MARATLEELMEPIMPAKGKYTTVKLETELVRKARVIVAIRDVLLVDFLSDALRPIVERDYERAVRDAAAGKGPKHKDD